MAKKDKFERLLDLIQNGRTSAIRKAAASQIGFLQKEFSYDLSTILHKLYPLLLYHDFECRSAAAMALENLIKNCRQERTKWKTNRPLMKLSQFNLANVVSSSKKILTHVLTDHNISDKDYKDQVFNVSSDPSNDVAELCEISEQMINKLNSPNWHYRHGAVVCLLSTIQPQCPKDYLEDLAVRLLYLIALDRFKDFSSDSVKVPVVDPACHLLARCLMLKINEAVPILEQFHSFYNEKDENSDQQDDGWSLRFAFWVIVQHMLLIDKNSLDPAWIQKSFLETVKNDQDEDQEEVITAALEALIMVIPRLPNPGDVAEKVYLDIFENAEDISSSNTASTKVLQSFIQECGIDDFVDDDTFDLLIKHGSFPQSSTREATYSLIITLLNRRGLDIYNGFDFTEFIIKLVNILLNETVPSLFAAGIEMLPCLNELMKVKRISFDEDIAAQVMDSMAEDIQKMKLIIPIIMKIADFCDIDESEPKFEHVKKVWGVAFCIILCLVKNTSTPVFMIGNTDIFTKDPINFFYSLFSLDSKKVISYVPRITKLHRSLALFACKYIGRFLHDEKDDDIISELIKMNVNFEESLLQSTFNIDTENPENDNRFYSNIIQQPTKEIFYAQKIAINAVYKVPNKLDDIFDLLQLMYCIQAKMTLPTDTIEMMINGMMRGSNYIPSMLAYNANLFAKMQPQLFLTSFVKMIQKNPDLSAGPIEFIDLFVTDFDTKMLDLLSWASFFVEPCLRNFANQDEVLRRMAAHSLSQIIRLLSLDNGNCSSLPEELHDLKKKSMQYLAPLFDVTKAPDWVLDPPPDFSFMNGGGKIRFYQRDGINWLGFLYNYGLNGILADDMGLGKTFQCLCAISNAHTAEYKSLPYSNRMNGFSGAPFSLVVCPPSVINHWVQETKNFFPKMPVNAFYVKNEVNAQRFEKMEGILITSYGVVRSALSVFTSRVFTYCVLDEGHVIKNKNAKVAQAVVKLRARHRLILSGTPIQNNVEELYSLMDFLMPGYLGTPQSFKKNFENLIGRMFSQDAKESDTEKGQEALQLLHCQVLPFIMRRLRNAVLEELPPRVIYDAVFQMTEVQRTLFNQLKQKSEALPYFSNNDGNDADQFADQGQIEIDEHVFTKMRKERDLCIHPCLIDPSVPRTIENSGKMKELKKILLTQLGLGGGNDQMRNRALLFAQSSKTLNIVKEIVLDNLEGVTYDFFDGRVSERDRPLVLDRFNRDDGPDLLLLTTQIGGLGLNLQVANNVIFLENSWNFTDDEQAMARAHRMGQKRTVTVFNLITSGTIEQRILVVQQNKRNMVNTIINEDNVQANADLSVMQDSFITDDKDKQTNSNKKLSQSEIMKESDKLVTNSEQYKRDYRDDDKWIDFQ